MYTTLSPGSEEANAKIRRQLEQLLNSKTFQQVDRLKTFISFIVEEAVAGRGDQLKEFLIGVEVFDKGTSFDSRTDPIVRVQARRLRTRLACYYREEGQDDEIVIELHKGGYAPNFLERRDKSTPRRPVTATLVSHNTVVVVPFEDHSPAGDQGYLCKGLGEEIIHALTKVGTIRVVAWDLPPSAEVGSRARGAADRLYAAIIVSGSIRKHRYDLRITTHLIDTVSGAFLWSDSVDCKMKNVLAAQEEIAHSIVKQLKSILTGTVTQKSARRATANPAAYNLFLQGRYHLNKRTEPGLHKAVEFFERALSEDSEYAIAHSGLADAYGLLTHYGVVTPAEAWAKAASHAASAVLLDDRLAEAHTSLAHVKSTQDWDWVGAEREFQRAIRLDPRYPTAHHWYSMSCLAPLARLDEALEQMLLAQALDPVSSIIARDLSMIHFYRRDFEATIEQYKETIELNPYFSQSYWMLGLVQEQQGNFDESIAAFQQALELSPESPRMHGALARAYALSGSRRKAIQILGDLSQLATERYVSPFEFASIYFALGNQDEGFEWLAKSCEERCFDVISINVDPRFELLKNESRFTELLDRLGLTP